MTITIRMPALSPTMETGSLVRWLVSVGDAVSAGSVIAEIGTDKATMEFEAVDDGIIGKVLVAQGTDDVAVGTPLAILLETGEDAQALNAVESTAADTAPSAPAVISNSDLSAATMPSAGSVLSSSRANVTGSEADFSHRPTERVSIRFALRDAMAEEMRRDQDVFVLGEEVGEYQGAYKVTQGLLDEFGATRVVDTPITEAGFAGMAVGAAFAGLKPIVEFMTFNFAMQAMDHIVNSAAKTLYMSGGQVPCPIVFRGPNGAAARVAAQHSQNFAAWFAHVPGLKVVAPCTGVDSKGLLKSAIRDPNPVVFLEHELLYGDTYDIPEGDDIIVPLGKAKIVRSGSDVTLVTYSIGLKWGLSAADRLADVGIDVEVIDLRSLRPLDMETILASLARTNRLVVVEEGWPVCGIGAEVCARAACEGFDLLDAPPTRVAGKDVPMPYAANLEQLALPSIEEIINAVRAVCHV